MIDVERLNAHLNNGNYYDDNEEHMFQPFRGLMVNNNNYTI